MKANLYFSLGILSISIIGVIVVAQLTRWGPGLLDWDSFNYIAAARSLARGDGLRIPANSMKSIPMVHFPPVFSIVLSLFELINIDAIIAARWLNSALFGINLMLFASLVYRFSNSKVIAFFSSLIFLFSADLLEAHANVLSEPLLITFFLSSFLFYLMWFTSRKSVWIVLIYSFIALSVLTKFIGISLAPSVAILFWFSNSQWKRKILLSFGALASGLFPFLLWSSRNFLLTNTINNRELIYIPITRGNLITAFHTFYSWFIPESLLFSREKSIFALSLVLLIAFGVFLIWKVGRSQIVKQQELLFCLLIITFYVAFVISAKTFLDPGIGFRDRMFIPLFPIILLVVVLGVRNLFSENWRLRKRLASLPFIYLILVSIIGSWASLPEIYNEGLGWNRRVIVTSKAMQELRELSASSKNMLFNNDIFGMYFYTGQVGEGLAQFPPEDAHEKVYLVIFKVHLDRQHPLLSKYTDELIPIVEDEILSIQLFESKENHP